MPRTDNSRKGAIRICADCGYELALGHDGPCPMCPRFEQLRVDFAMPRPSELAAHRAALRGAHSGASGDQQLTPSGYRALLAERRLGSVSDGEAHGRVVRTRALTQARVLAPPRSEDGTGSDLPPPSRPKKSPGRDPSPRPRKPKGRVGEGASERATRARGSTERAAGEHKSGASRPSSAPLDVDAPGTLEAGQPKRVDQPSIVAVVPEASATPSELARAIPRVMPRTSRSRSANAPAPWRSIVQVAIIVAVAALIGAAVPMLLALR